MYSALTIARYVINRCNEQKRIISNLKLQKILYFIQAEFLVSSDKKCFEESIEAWDFGPVVPEVYREYRIYGSSSIPSMDNSFNDFIDESDKIMINGIVDDCSKYSATTLVNITHQQSPWRDAYYQPGHNNQISAKSIREYFKED